MATCHRCGQAVPDEEVLVHAAESHGLDIEPATWPDGTVVAFPAEDLEINPDDFA